jgi:O-acetylserine/cysteine efflux transporter
MPLSHVLLAVAVAAVYGVAFVAIKTGVGELPPLLMTGYRFLFAAVPLVLFIRPPALPWKWIFAYAFVQNVAMFGLLFVSISLGMPAGLASLVAQSQVFFTILFSAALFSERPSGMQIAGAAIAAAGILAIGATLDAGAPLLPFLLVVASAAAWGVANIIAKAGKAGEPLPFVAWSSLLAAPMLFLLSSLLERTTFGLPATMPSLATIGAILFLAWPTTVFAFSAWVFLLRRHAAAAVTPFALLIPVFGMGSTALAFGERLSAATAAGACLVMAGLAVNVFASRRAALREGARP